MTRIPPIDQEWGCSPAQVEDIMLRDMLMSSATVLTEEQMRDIQQEAPWIKLTDEGIEYSKGMVELLKGIWGDLDESLIP